jgi:hypothetical protein
VHACERDPGEVPGSLPTACWGGKRTIPRRNEWFSVKGTVS